MENPERRQNEELLEARRLRRLEQKRKLLMRQRVLAAVLLALRILKKKDAPRVWSRILMGLTAASMAVIFGAMALFFSLA